MSAEVKQYSAEETAAFFAITKGWYGLCTTIFPQLPEMEVTTPTHLIKFDWGKQRGMQYDDAIRTSDPRSAVVRPGAKSAELSVIPRIPGARSARVHITPIGEVRFEQQPQIEDGVPQVAEIKNEYYDQAPRLVSAAQPLFDAILASPEAQRILLSPEEKDALDAKIAQWYEAAGNLLLDKGESFPPQHNLLWHKQTVIVHGKTYIIDFSLLALHFTNGNDQVSIRIIKQAPPLPTDGHEEEQRRRLANPDHKETRNLELKGNGDAKSSFVTTNQLIYEREDTTYILFGKDVPYTPAHVRETYYLSQFLDPILSPAEK